MVLEGSGLIIFAVGVTVAVLLLVYLLQRSRKVIKQKEEKIKWLRQISAENDHRHSKRANEDEKKIIELTHRVSMLESRLKEGTKNQVVAKIEAMQTKRDRVLKRAGIDPQELGNG